MDCEAGAQFVCSTTIAQTIKLIRETKKHPTCPFVVGKASIIQSTNIKCIYKTQTIAIYTKISHTPLAAQAPLAPFKGISRS